MKISQILNTLQSERDVIVGGACISTELVKYMGDIPVYNFKISCVRQLGDYHGIEVLYANTVAELIEIIHNDEAFSVCPICGEVIEGLKFNDIENGLEFCSKECFTEHLENKAACACEFCEDRESCPMNCTCDALDDSEDEDRDPYLDKDFSEFTPEELENMGGFTGTDFIPDDPLETDDGDYTEDYELQAGKEDFNDEFGEPGEAETGSEE